MVLTEKVSDHVPYPSHPRYTWFRHLKQKFPEIFDIFLREKTKNSPPEQAKIV